MKPTIAIIMAGGRPHPDFGPLAPDCKALLPVGERVLVDFVIEPLEEAGFERLFVFHDGCIDKSHLSSATNRTTLVTRPDHARSFAEGIHFAVRTVATALGADALAARTLMLVPCDHPRFSPIGLRSVVDQFHSTDADVGFVIIPTDRLDECLPHATHRGIPFADLGGKYSAHSLALLNGASVRLEEDETVVCLRDWTPGDTRSLVGSIERARQGRSRPWQIPMLVHELVVRRVIRRRSASRFIRALARFFAGRLRTADGAALLDALFGLRVVGIESRWPEFSIDVDRPGDYERVFGLAWPPPQP